MAVSFNRYLILPEIERESRSRSRSSELEALEAEPDDARVYAACTVYGAYTADQNTSCLPGADHDDDDDGDEEEEEEAPVCGSCGTCGRMATTTTATSTATATATIAVAVVAGAAVTAPINPIVTVPLCVLGEVQLRFLCPDDLEEVRALCQDWFPIDYPYSWYEDITSSSRFYALAAVYGGVIIGLIVAEIKPYAKLNKEDRGILCSSLGKDSLVGYILSLGVRRAYRRNGIASLLLEQLLAHVTAPERSSVKAVFLHVLSSNAPAILFYQRCHFRLHSFLPYYYSIRGKCKDGFTYVLYVNGGHAPWGIWDWVCHLAGAMASLGPCRVPRWIWQRFRWATAILSYHR